jgi:hypothetical protein
MPNEWAVTRLDINAIKELILSHEDCISITVPKLVTTVDIVVF